MATGVSAGCPCPTPAPLVPLGLGHVLSPVSTCSTLTLLHPVLSYLGFFPSLKVNMRCHMQFLGKLVFALLLLW